jgi:hypothetical protein
LGGNKRLCFGFDWGCFGNSNNQASVVKRKADMPSMAPSQKLPPQSLAVCFGKKPSDKLKIRRNENVPESFETFIKSKADDLDNPVWKRFLDLRKAAKVRLVKVCEEGLPAGIKALYKSELDKINDDPELIRRGIYSYPEGMYFPLTDELIFPQFRYMRDKEVPEPRLNLLSEESYDDIMTHEAAHKLDHHLGNTSLKDYLKNNNLLKRLAKDSAIIAGGLMIPVVGWLFVLNGSIDLLTTSFLACSYKAFSNGSKFLHALMQDLPNITRHIPKKFHGTKLFSKLKEYYSRPSEAFAHGITSLYMDSGHERTQRIQKMYPHVIEHIKKEVLPTLFPKEGAR